jgi:hypothetical protein
MQNGRAIQITKERFSQKWRKTAVKLPFSLLPPLKWSSRNLKLGGGVGIEDLTNGTASSQECVLDNG